MVFFLITFLLACFLLCSDFGIELGFVKAEYNFVKEFPYNIGLPHPMITGQVCASIKAYYNLGVA